MIVPIYNAEKKIEKCIKSILNQTFFDLEIILVNDGSTDETLSICKKYKAIDNRIVLIDKDNEGSVITRRKGLEVSKADYVMFVDADDWIHRKTIEVMYSNTINCDVDVTVCNMQKVLSDKLYLKRKNKSIYFRREKIYNNEDIKNTLLTAYFHGHPFPPSLCAKLYKKELFKDSGKYAKKIHFLGDDLYINMEVLLKANSLKIITKPFYNYRLGGYTSKYMPYFFDDIINGYTIQKEVINEFYTENKAAHLNGISIMLLNTFKTCLHNLFCSNFSKLQIKNQIKKYINNSIILEAIDNQGSMKYFEMEYLNAIKFKNIDYLFEIGLNLYNSKRAERFIRKLISRIS